MPSNDLYKMVLKDLRKIVKKATKAGWTLERVGHARSRKGVKLVSPDGSVEIAVPRHSTGELNRNANKARKELRRHGFE